MQKKYGYVRVSSKDQNEERQVIAMYEQGITDCDIFVDKVSGKDFDRPNYKRLMNKVRKGDIIYIHSIDRLGRNYTEILNQWSIITKSKQVNMVVLDMPLLNTTTNTDNDLTGTFIADLVLQILSYVAQTERENIKKRQAEGIRAAKLRGVHCGRKPKPVPENFKEVVIRWRKKEISAIVAAEILGVSKGYLYKYAKQMNLF